MTNKIKLLIESIAHCSVTDVAGISILYIAKELLETSTKLDEAKQDLKAESVNLYNEIEELKNPKLYSDNLDKQLVMLRDTLKTLEFSKYKEHIMVHLKSEGFEIIEQYNSGEDTKNYVVKFK